MARRAPCTRVERDGQRRPPHVQGMGDVVFKGFQCLQSDCREFIVTREDQLGPDFEIVCRACSFAHTAGGETGFFDYRLVQKGDPRPIEEGKFTILHDDYIREAQRFKYCLLCYALKPLDLFDVHNARRSGRQGECRLCKTIYNGIKNQSRTTDQHREAAQRRRLYKRLSGEAEKSTARQYSRSSTGAASIAVGSCNTRRSGKGKFIWTTPFPSDSCGPCTLETLPCFVRAATIRNTIAGLPSSTTFPSSDPWPG